MKHMGVSVWLLLTMAIIGCTEPAPVEAELDPKKEYTLDVQQAKRWLPGRWTLLKIHTIMSSNPPVPKVELLIDANQIRLIQDGVQTDTVDFEIVKTAYGLLVKTNAQLRPDNWYVRNPSLYLNKDRMILGSVEVMDAPVYEFKKVN